MKTVLLYNRFTKGYPLWLSPIVCRDTKGYAGIDLASDANKSDTERPWYEC